MVEVAFIVAFLLLVPAAGAAQDRPTPPWQAAETIRTALFDARTDLLLDGSSERRALERADAALSGPLERGLAEHAPADLRQLRDALADADRAVTAEDPVALATAYGTAVGALRAGAYEVTTAIAAAAINRPTLTGGRLARRITNRGVRAKPPDGGKLHGILMRPGFTAVPVPGARRRRRRRPDGSRRTRRRPPAAAAA